MTSRRRKVRPIRSLSALRETAMSIAHARGARNVRVFGSFARGDQRATSDLDLLVELPSTASLLDLSGLKVDLEEALGMKVDVIPDDSIHPLLRSRILSEARPL